MKALYLHGFLGSANDMRPLFLDDVQCESVNVLSYLNKPKELIKDFKGPYDFAVAYSYGGRLLAKCLELEPEFVEKPVFCSSRISVYTEEELLSRRVFQEKLIGLVKQSLPSFYDYWDGLELFSGHSMKGYRDKHSITYDSWTKNEILNFLENHFTYETPNLKQIADRSLYFYGESDYKYKAQKFNLEMDSFQFDNLGHRFLFEDPNVFKSVLKDKVLIK